MSSSPRTPSTCRSSGRGSAITRPLWRDDLIDFLSGDYEAAVDQGLTAMVRERVADGEDEWIPLEQVKKDLDL